MTAVMVIFTKRSRLYRDVHFPAAFWRHLRGKRRLIITNFPWQADAEFSGKQLPLEEKESHITNGRRRQSFGFHDDTWRLALRKWKEYINPLVARQATPSRRVPEPL